MVQLSMKSNPERIVHSKEVIRSAEQITKEKHFKFRLLVKTLISNRTGKYLLFFFAYLRWVDDFIDEESNTISEKRNFLKGQLELFESILRGKIFSVTKLEENFLLYYLDYAHSINSNILIEGLRSILETFETDINKLATNGLIAKKEFDNYIATQTKSLFYIIYHFLMNGCDLDINNCPLASFYHLDLLRDLKEDADMGYINSNIEEIKNFNLDYNDLANDKNLVKWISFKVSEIEEMLTSELEIIREMPFKVKLFFFGLFPYVNAKMIRLKIYNYQLNYIDCETFNKEIKIKLLSITHSIRYFFKIFLVPNNHIVKE